MLEILGEDARALEGEGDDALAGVAFGQNLARGADVQREPEQRERQEEHGETRELRRILDVKDGEQHQQREPDAQREEGIDDERRHRHDQHQHDAEQADGHQQVGALQQQINRILGSSRHGLGSDLEAARFQPVEIVTVRAVNHGEDGRHRLVEFGGNRLTHLTQ